MNILVRTLELVRPNSNLLKEKINKTSFGSCKERPTTYWASGLANLGVKTTALEISLCLSPGSYFFILFHRQDHL
jgi:hypothetical protein